jgi:hypothetical protein
VLRHQRLEVDLAYPCLRQLAAALDLSRVAGVLVVAAGTGLRRRNLAASTQEATAALPLPLPGKNAVDA